MFNAIERLRFSLTDLAGRLIDPKKQIQDWRLRLDDLASRASRQALVLLERNKEGLKWWQDRLVALSPHSRVFNLNAMVNQNQDNLLKIINSKCDYSAMLMFIH